MTIHTNIMEIGLTAIDGEPRARDLDIADRLGFKRTRKIRELIERNKDEFEAFGSLAPQRGASRGQEFTEFWLNEEQALLAAALSNADKAAAVRHMLIKVFVAWRRGHLVPADGERQLGISKMTIHKVTNLEKTVDDLTYRINALLINTDARVAALEYVSVRELLAEAKALQKRRGRLNRKIGWELRERALVQGHPQPCRKCPHSNVWLFQRDFALRYMAERGNTLVADHNSAQIGQSVIKFPRKGIVNNETHGGEGV